MKALRNLRRKAGHTLTELGITAGCFAVVGGTMYVLMSAGLNLFARNHAINKSSELARTALDRMTRDMHGAIEVPKLVDAAGATVTSSDGSTVTAAGVKFRMYVAGPIRIPSATSATTTSVTLAIQASDVRPTEGQFLVIPASTLNVLPQDVYARITAVTGSPLSPVVALSGTLGSCLTPTATSGTVAPADTVAYIVQEVSYIVTTPRSPAPQVPELRFYRRALNVATDGLTAFHNPANFAIITPNMVTTRTPFRHAPGDRALSVVLTAEDDRYNNRISSSFTKSLSIGTTTTPHTIPYKSLGL